MDRANTAFLGRATNLPTRGTSKGESMADYSRFDKVAAEQSDDDESPDLPLVPPPETEATPPAAEPVVVPLTADALAAHVERVGTIDVEEAAVRGVPLNAPQRSNGRTHWPVAAAGSSIPRKGAYDAVFA